MPAARCAMRAHLTVGRLGASQHAGATSPPRVVAAATTRRSGVTVAKGVKGGHASFPFSFEFEREKKAKVGERAPLTHSTGRRTCP